MSSRRISLFAILFAVTFAVYCSSEPTNTATDAGTPATGDVGTITEPPDGSFPDAAAPGDDAGADAGPALADGGPVTPFNCPAYTATYTSAFTLTGANFCEAWAKLSCDYELKCCRGDRAGYDNCVRVKQHDCEKGGDFAARVAAGALNVDLAKAKTCFDYAAASTDCSLDVETLVYGSQGYSIGQTECMSMFGPGHVETGSCLDDGDCQASWCERLPATCGGTCKPAKSVGAACESDQQCGAANWCDDNGKCAARLASGATGCDAQTAAPCPENEFCKKAVSGTTTSYTCTARVAAAATCEAGQPFGQCVEGYVCNGTCDKLHTVAAGSPCDDEDSCVAGSYCKPAAAGTFGTCTAYTAIGSACSNDAECGPTGFCPATGNKVCTALGDVNSLCTPGEYECKSGLFCARKSHTCAKYEDNNADCDAVNGPYCNYFLRCTEQGKCTEVPGTVDTDWCDDDFGCQTSMYCDGDYYCANRIANGAACDTQSFYGNDCASGVCETDATGTDKCLGGCTY